MRRLAMFAPFAAAALIAGCGSSSSSTPTTGSSSPAGSSGSATAVASGSGGGSRGGSGGVSLSETEFRITPADPKIAKTGKITITITNHGSITHALAVQTPSGISKTPNLTPGQSAKLTVNISKAGKYTFFCPIGNHRQAGMHGMLVVGSGGASGSAGGSSQTTSTGSSSGGGGYAY
jgi:plastocyanin